MDFAPNRRQHDTLNEVTRLIEKGKTGYVVDADIKGYFNNLEHDKIIERVRFRLAGPNILWLINKMLKAGVVEDGKWQPTVKGTEQGNLASPVIANIYMHYTLSLWFELRFKKTCRGESGLVIYADDFIATFQYKGDAERFLKETAERFATIGLEFEPGKTQLVEFGRFAEEARKKQGAGKPDTFDFLGFAHLLLQEQQGMVQSEAENGAKKISA